MLSKYNLFFWKVKVRIQLMPSVMWAYIVTLLDLNGENYIILGEYIKCVIPPLTEVVGPSMNLISGTHDFCEKREYVFYVLPEYNIITPSTGVKW